MRQVCLNSEGKNLNLFAYLYITTNNTIALVNDNYYYLRIY